MLCLKAGFKNEFINTSRYIAFEFTILHNLDVSLSFRVQLDDHLVQ